MKIVNCITESAYPVAVDWEDKDTNGENTFKVTIDGTSLFVNRDDWDKIDRFIRNSMSFIDNNFEE